MAGFVKGDVVVVPFPFSDLSSAKRRPALVVAALPGDDLILCQITSQAVRDGFALLLDDSAFQQGGLRLPSNARPNRLFTAERRIIVSRAGRLRREKCDEIIEAIIAILRK